MKKLSLEDFTNYKFLSKLEFSPDGLNTAFVSHRVDLDKNSYKSNIYNYNHNSGSILKLTSLNDESLFAWRDSSKLIFSSFRNEEDRKRRDKGEPFSPIYEISLKGGEANKVFELPLVVNSMKSFNLGS